MKEINIYLTFESWYEETPDAVIKGEVLSREGDFVEIQDENKLTQLINKQKIYALVY